MVLRDPISFNSFIFDVLYEAKWKNETLVPSFG